MRSKAKRDRVFSHFFRFFLPMPGTPFPSPSSNHPHPNNAKSDLVALEIFHLTFPRQTICRTLRRVLQLGALETSKFQKFFFKLKNFQRNLEMKYKFETSQMRRESW